MGGPHRRGRDRSHPDGPGVLMATRAAAAPTARGSREGPAERLAEFVVLGGMAALAVGLRPPARRSSRSPSGAPCTPSGGAPGASGRRPSLLCALPALAALLWAYVALGADPVAVATGYVDVQLDAAEAVARAWPVGRLDAPAGGPTRLAVWPYAVAGGAPLGALGNALHSLAPRLCSRETKAMRTRASWCSGTPGTWRRRRSGGCRWAVPTGARPGRGVAAECAAGAGQGLVDVGLAAGHAGRGGLLRPGGHAARTRRPRALARWLRGGAEAAQGAVADRGGGELRARRPGGSASRPGW